jgi:inner membrane protein
MKRESILLRLLIISGIIILLVIPLIMIQSLINERQSYRDQVVKEVSDSWASVQKVAGPVLTIKNKKIREDDQDKKSFSNVNYHLLPENLLIESTVYPETRYRGIYETTLYKTDIRITGYFDFTKFENLKYEEIISEAVEKYVSFNISDLKGIEDNIFFKWNGVNEQVNSGLKNNNYFERGLSSAIEINNNNKKYSFEFIVHLKGSQRLEFLPLGKNTTVKMKSTWINPSFMGEFLPTTRNLSSEGFNAEWKINQFNRNYPQYWTNGSYNLLSSSFGVNFLIPVNEYQKTMRTSKYGIMILLLTFVIFFMIEVFNKRTLHPIQYLLIGLSLIIFYAILLALSEYMLFQYSYIISATLVITLISFYTSSVYSNARLGGAIGGILILFYGFMYTILQLQDYSLLIGILVLFLILAGIMVLTRRIDWYDVLSNEKR